MTELCSIFEQVNRYVGALNAGMPSAAKGFKEGIYDTIRKVNSCGDICDKRRYPLPCCCKTFYLDCGTTLVLSRAEDFELISEPRNGSIVIDEYVSYVPNDGFQGEDEFEYRQAGVYNKVCIEVVEFEATLTVTEENEFLQRLTIDTNCASATVDWGEGIDETDLSIVVPKGIVYDPIVSCGECVIDIEPCIFCDIYTPLYEETPVAREYELLNFTDFEGNVTSLNKDASDVSITEDLQTFVDGQDVCSEPYVVREVEGSRNTAVYFIIEDSPALIESIKVKLPASESGLNPYFETEVDTYLGGNCYPVTDYQLRVDLDKTEIINIQGFTYVLDFVTDNNLATANLSTLASEIQQGLLLFPGIVADVDIHAVTWQGNVIYYNINISTNSPLGVVMLRNPSGDFNDPNNVKVTGFDKI